MENGLPWFQQLHLFTSGIGGYFRYRIPALLISQRGAILAFCEARKFTGRDSDQIDILLRRSFDGGNTFDEPRIILSEEGWVCGNPAPVLDHDTGIIWLLFCKNRIEDTESKICRGEGSRTIWLTCSRNDGENWGEPVEVTARVKPAEWDWYATGPGHGIQLNSSRLLIPCDHSLNHPELDSKTHYFSHVIYSDDHGCTWMLGGSAPEDTNECTAVETVPGQVYLNCRNAPGGPLQRSNNDPQAGEPCYRIVAWGEDNGKTFPNFKVDLALPEPICQASLCRLTDQYRHDRNRVIFSNPASHKRENMTVRLSYDECRTWPVSRTIYQGPAAYSDLCVTQDSTICCLFESGTHMPYETLTFARFNLAWLEEPAKE